jgi:hypothetical protein
MIFKKIGNCKYNIEHLPRDHANNENTYYTVYRENNKIYTRTRTEEDAIKIISLYQLTNIDTLYYKRYTGKKNIISYHKHKERILKEFFFKIKKIEDKFDKIPKQDNLNETDKLEYYMKMIYGDDPKRQYYDKHSNTNKEEEIKPFVINDLNQESLKEKHQSEIIYYGDC